MVRIQCVVIGYGAMHNFGWMHATWIRACKRFELAGICDASKERQEKAAEDFPGVKIYRKASDVFEDENIDMVSIVTPNFTHMELVVQALNYGKHVLVENAMCLNLGEAEIMVEAAERAGKMLCVHHNRRHDGNYRAIKEIVESGKIGEIFQIELFPTWYKNPFKGASPDLWWADKNRSGGLFFYYGSQAFDWLLDLIPSEIEGVTAFAHKKAWFNVTNEDQVTAILKFANGAVANFTESYIDCSPRPFWRILGSKGAILDWDGSQIPGYQQKINAPSCGNIEVYTGDEDGNINKETIPYKDSDWDSFYNEIAEHILDGRPNPVSGETGRRVLGIVDAAKKSIESGKTEKLKYS